MTDISETNLGISFWSYETLLAISFKVQWH